MHFGGINILVLYIEMQIFLIQNPNITKYYTYGSNIVMSLRTVTWIQIVCVIGKFKILIKLNKAT